MKENPERKSSLVSVAIAAIGAAVIFLPGILEMRGEDGGYALSALGVLVLITGVVAAIVYGWRATKLDAMLAGQNLLAHWTYTRSEWQRYAEKAHKDKKSANKALFFIISGWAIIIGVALFIKDPDSGKYVALVMLGLIAVMGILAYLTTVLEHRRNRKNLGEAYIATDGVYLNRVLHTWKGLATHLDSVVYEEDSQSLVFSYIAVDRVGPHPYAVRVPVPRGQEARAREILERLKPANR